MIREETHPNLVDWHMVRPAGHHSRRRGRSLCGRGRPRSRLRCGKRGSRRGAGGSAKVPEAHRAVARAGGHRPRRALPRAHALDAARVASERDDEATGLHVPEAAGLVAAARHQPPPAVAPGKVEDRVLVRQPLVAARVVPGVVHAVRELQGREGEAEREGGKGGASGGRAGRTSPLVSTSVTNPSSHTPATRWAWSGDCAAQGG